MDLKSTVAQATWGFESLALRHSFHEVTEHACCGYLGFGADWQGKIAAPLYGDSFGHVVKPRGVEAPS